jgi:uncharacterized metal-binding protein YceD (DUF177 family)
MANPLFNSVLPERLASRGVTIDTTLKVEQLSRIAAIIEQELASLDGADSATNWRQYPVEIKLAFQWADGRAGFVQSEGEVSTTIVAVCQRCLKPFEMPLWASLDLLYVAPEIEVAGDGHLEVWELEEEFLRPLDVVEEALVLAIPFAPMHQKAKECSSLAEFEVEAKPDVQNPFAGLKQQMQDQD